MIVKGIDVSGNWQSPSHFDPILSFVTVKGETHLRCDSAGRALGFRIL